MFGYMIKINSVTCNY